MLYVFRGIISVFHCLFHISIKVSYEYEEIISAGRRSHKIKTEMTRKINQKTIKTPNFRDVNSTQIFHRTECPTPLSLSYTTVGRKYTQVC